MTDIKTLLENTKRGGIANLIAEMEQNGFFEAPCSGGNHLCEPGGLAIHSANVANTAIALAKSLAELPEIMDAKEEYKALIMGTKRAHIRALLITMDAKGFFSIPCKGKRHKGQLAEHSLKTAYAALKIAEAVGYTNRDAVILCAALHDVGDIESTVLAGTAANIPDSIRTALYVERIINLTEEEEWAIITHDALYGDMKTEFIGHETPLALIVHWAELWALHVEQHQTLPTIESVTICAALHDLGKIGDYGKQLYVPNILKSGKLSTAKPYKRNNELSNIPHSVRSIKIAWRCIDLTEEEKWAILAHDGLYDYLRTAIIGHETPLSMIIHWADMWSAHVLEKAEECEDTE